MIAEREITTEAIAEESVTQQFRILAALFSAVGNQLPNVPGYCGERGAPNRLAEWEFLSRYTLTLTGSEQADFTTRPLAGLTPYSYIVPARHDWMDVGACPTGQTFTDEFPKDTNVLNYCPVVKIKPIQLPDNDHFAVERIVENMAHLASVGEIAAALDVVFDFVESEMLAHGSGRCDRFLDRLRAEILPTEVLLGVLTATRPWRRELSKRAALVRRTEELLLAKYAQDRVDRILSGLE